MTLFATIEGTIGIAYHEYEQRLLKKCSECKKRRLTTRCTLCWPNSRKEDIFLCNSCLTITPNWINIP